MDNRIDKIIISSMRNVFARTIMMVVCLYFVFGLVPQKNLLDIYQYYHLVSATTIILLSLIQQFLVIRATDVIDTYQHTLSVKQRMEMYRKTGTSGIKLLIFVACSVLLLMLTETVLLPINASNQTFWAVSVSASLSLLIEIVSYSLSYIKAFRFIMNIQSEE